MAYNNLHTTRNKTNQNDTFRANFIDYSTSFQKLNPIYTYTMIICGRDEVYWLLWNKLNAETDAQIKTNVQ